MTPAQHAAAKTLFRRAIELPEEERNALCDAEAVGDAEVVREVRTLLKYHNDASLLKTMEIMGEQTPFAGNGSSPFSIEKGAPSSFRLSEREEGVSRLEVIDDRSMTDLEARMNASSRQFLKRRLLIAVAVLTVVMTSIRIGVFAFGDPARDNAFRLGLVIVLASIWFVLKYKHALSLRTLRILVAIVVAMPMFELIEIQIQESEDLALAGRLDEIPVLMLSINMATALLISLYSTFLPSNWKRTAVIAGVMAVAPAIVAWIHGNLSKALSETEMVPFVGPLLTSLTAGVATAGAHFVHRMRLEAEDARSYGQYRLLEEIGRGGMGVVYRAEHHMLKRPAAIKLIHAHSAAEERVIKQFEQEVQISATLTHWNTVQIYDYGTTEAGDFFYVMEYLDGDTLSDRNMKRGPLSELDTTSIAMQLCEGLADAHDRGMVHRDLKPANIFLARIGGQSDVVKIVDFGLAVVPSGDRRMAAAGTPGYMSPEQIAGDPLDGRSDIYAIGCVLYESLAGQTVFPIERLDDVLQNHLFKIPDLEGLNAVAPKLKPIIQKCLAKQPNQRFQNVKELLTALKNESDANLA